jgi:hypothetical protein
MSEKAGDYRAQMTAQMGPLMVHQRARESHDFAQMKAALTEIRERAATMERGGAWAAGLAALCLGTLWTERD